MAEEGEYERRRKEHVEADWLQVRAVTMKTVAWDPEKTRSRCSVDGIDSLYRKDSAEAVLPYQVILEEANGSLLAALAAVTAKDRCEWADSRWKDIDGCHWDTVHWRSDGRLEDEKKTRQHCWWFRSS